MLADRAFGNSIFQGRAFAKSCDSQELLFWGIGEVLATEMYLKIRGRQIAAIALEGTGPRFPVVVRKMGTPPTSPVKVCVGIEAVFEEAGIGAKIAENMASSC